MSKNLTLTTIIFFFLGACSAGKVNVTFVYLTELVPERNRTAVGSFVQFADAWTVLFLPIYFRFVTKEWIYFQIGSFAMNIVAVLVLLTAIPESPKYLHASGKIKECIQIIRYIAKINRVEKEVIETIEITDG
jgi:MFS family permease